jgi:uncharacterized protein
MKAVVSYDIDASRIDQIPLHIAAHRGWWQEFANRGELLMVGPFANVHDGAMAVFTTRAAAEAFVHGDPFVQTGIVHTHTIRDWQEALIPYRPRSPP